MQQSSYALWLIKHLQVTAAVVLLTTMGTVLSTIHARSHLPTILSSQQTWTIRTLTSPILQISKLELPRVKKFAKSHKTIKCQGWDSSPSSCKVEPVLMAILSHLPPGFPPNFSFSSIFQILLGPSFNAIKDTTLSISARYFWLSAFLVGGEACLEACFKAVWA